MAFDPDQYLAGSAPPASGFNPDAYLATKPNGKIDFQALRQSEALKQSVQNDPINTDARMEIAKDEGVLPRYLGGRPSASYVQRVAAAPATRFAVGAAAPFLGAGQLAMNAVGQGDAPNHLLQQYEQMKQEGGSGGPDVLGFAGNVLGPVGLVAAKTVTPAASWYGRAGQGAALGTGFGATAPVTNGGENYWSDKGVQTGGGALIGGAIPLAIDTTKKLADITGNLTGPMREGWMTRQGQKFIENELGITGTVKDQVRNAITNRAPILANSPMTVGDAIAAANMDSTSKFGKGLIAAENALSTQGGGGIADKAATIAALQEDARLQAISRISKGIVERDAAERLRRNTALPIMETELKAANTAGELLPVFQGQADALSGAASNRVADVRRLELAKQLAQGRADTGDMRLTNMVPGSPQGIGMPNVPQRYSRAAELLPVAERGSQQAADASLLLGEGARFAQMQADSLAAHGLTPLSISKIDNQIAQIQNATGNKTNIPLQKAMGTFRDLLAKGADSNGVIPAEELHTIRKQAGDWIKNAAGEGNATNVKVTAALERQVQGLIDKAIVGAGGTRWPQFLETYGNLSRPLERMDVGQQLKDALMSATGAERQVPFANAVRNIQQTVSKDSNRPLIDALNATERQSVSNVTRDIQREVERNALGKSVDTGNLFNIADKGKGTISIPHLLSRPATIANWLMKSVGQGADEKISQDIGKLMLTDPDGFAAKYLSNIAPTKQHQIAEYLRKYSPLATQGAVQAQGQ